MVNYTKIIESRADGKKHYSNERLESMIQHRIKKLNRAVRGCERVFYRDDKWIVEETIVDVDFIPIGDDEENGILKHGEIQVFTDRLEEREFVPYTDEQGDLLTEISRIRTIKNM